MLQKVKKGYLADLLFFIILFLGLWAIYKKRAYILSGLISRFTHSEFKIGKVINKGPLNTTLYGVRAPHFSIDTIRISTSFIELVRLRLRRIDINGIHIYLNSLSKNAQNVSRQRQKHFKIPNLPFFIYALQVKNMVLYYKNDSVSLKKLKVRFNGSTHRFSAQFTMEDLSMKDFHLDFFKSTIYHKKNAIELENGELASNIFYIDNIRATYDSTVVLNLRGITSNNMNIVLDRLSIHALPNLTYINVNMHNIEVLQRTIKNSNFDIKLDKNTFKYNFTLASDWLHSQGNGEINYKDNFTYSIHINRFSYEEKDAYLRGKLFVKGKRDRLKGLLKVDTSYYRGRPIGSITAFFNFKRPMIFTLDSVSIQNSRSLTVLNGTITPELQRLHIFPDIHIADYDTTLNGHIKGEIITTIIKGKKVSVDGYLQASHLHSPYGTVKDVTLNMHSIKDHTLQANIQASGVIYNEKIAIDSLFMNANIKQLSTITYKLRLTSQRGRMYLKGNAQTKRGEYTARIDTMYGIINKMHIFSEKGIFASYKKDTVYLATGNLYAEKGRLNIKGTFDRYGTMNISIETDSLVLPYPQENNMMLSTKTVLKGTLNNPILISSGNIHNPKFHGISAENIAYSLSFERHILSIKYLKILRNEGEMLAQGTLTFGDKLYPIIADSITPDITVEFKTFDITPAFSYISDVYNIEYASVDGDIILQGTLKHPLFRGTILINGQNGYLPAVGIRTDNIKGYIQFKGDEIILRSLRGESDAGEIIARGKIKSTSALFDSPDISISAKDIYIEIGSEIEGVCDANLYLTRGEKTPLLIKGDVKVKEGYLFAEFKSPPTVSKEEYNPILSMNINISWDNNVFLLNEMARIEFSGKLSYIYGLRGMLLNGKLTVLSGDFSYFDRMFKVADGTVEFNNLSKIDPELDINAETDVDSYTVRLNISGTLTEPVINLTSTPSLDESNIIALLTFGKLLSQGSFNVLTTTLLEKKALGFAQSYLTRSIRSKLGLRELEVSSGSIEEDPHLSIGFYVSSNIYLKYYHDFLSIQYDRFDLRYKISRYFGLNAIRDEEGRYYFGLSFEKRF